jgi:hypothetical protein
LTDSPWNQVRLNPSFEIHATLTLLFSSVSPSLILKLHTFHYNPEKYSAKFERNLIDKWSNARISNRLEAAVNDY